MAFTPFPPHLVDILTVHRNSRRALELRDELWKHLEVFLAEKGYKIAWDGDSMTSPAFPLASNPFSPKPGEAFSAATAGRNGIKWGGPRANPFVMGAYDRYRRFVVIKIISASSPELALLQRFSAPAARHDPHNHIIPVLEYVSAGDWTLIVMPSWETSLRECVPLSRPSECLALAVQSLEGLAYMHKQKVAHLDVYPSNILCNHIANRPSTSFLRAFDFRLAYIDFGFSRYIPGAIPSLDVRHLPPTYHDLPEVKARWRHVNPFSADIFALGKSLEGLIKSQIEFERAHRIVEPMSRVLPQRYLKLVEGMTAEDPSGRPTAMQALTEAQNIMGSL